MIKNLSLECLALYVILDKKVCREYFRVYKHSLDEAVKLYQQESLEVMKKSKYQKTGKIKRAKLNF